MALFDPRPLTSNLPFPSDLFTIADSTSYTGRRLNLDRWNTPLIDEIFQGNPWLMDQINLTDGFGVSSHVFLPLFNDDNGIAGLPAIANSDSTDSSILLLELDAAGNVAGQVQFEALHRPYMDQIELTPLHQLKSATTYLAVLTDRVADSQGRGLCPSWQFWAVRSADPLDDNPDMAELEPLRQEWAPYFDLLAAAPFDLPRERIVQLTPFTTCAVEQALDDIRAELIELAELEPPQFENISISSGGSRTHVGAIVRGTLHTPQWQDADGRFVHDPQSLRPVQQSAADLGFILTIPRPQEAGGPPYPVVISLHGINSSKESLLSFADEFAAAGLALIGIDHPFHGDRGDPDGGSIDPAGRILALGDPLRMRDNFREGTAENLWLIRAVMAAGALDLSPYNVGGSGDGRPDLDPQRLLVFGHSMGALFNSMLYTSEPELIAAAGTAGGGGWTNEVFYSPYLDTAMEIFQALGLDFTWPPDSARLFFLWYQGMIDPGDSNSYARFLRYDPRPEAGPRPYLMLEAVGDGTVPNEVTNGWARYGDVPLIVHHGDVPLTEPDIDPVEGLEIVPAPAEDWGLFQYPTDNHDFFYGGWYQGYARQQVLHFFTTALAGGPAEIVNPLPAD